MYIICVDFTRILLYNVVRYRYIKLIGPKFMKRKEDARVVRTKSRLFNAFTELLSEKTFEEITIQAICNRSNVRRATFYKHFSDKYDFLAGLTRDLRGKFEENFNREAKLTDLAPAEYYLKYLRAIIDFLDKNEAIVKLILNSSLSSAMVSVVVEENYIRTKEKLDEDVRNGLGLIASTDTVAIYIAGGISNAIIKWLTLGKNIPREEFIKELGSLLFAVFEK